MATRKYYLAGANAGGERNELFPLRLPKSGRLTLFGTGTGLASDRANERTNERVQFCLAFVPYVGSTREWGFRLRVFLLPSKPPPEL